MTNFRKHFLLLAFAAVMSTTVLAQYSSRLSKTQEADFPWPDGKQVAVSLSFDDGRASQVDNGIPILNKYGVKATFFINPANISERAEDWKLALAEGHEIANHTLTHPCTGNFLWSRDNALEDLTLENIAAEMDGASQAIEKIFGIVPATFAYPCGQKFVGRGQSVQSYVPLVAKRFVAGRGWLDEASNDPVRCDLAQLLGMEIDGVSFVEVEALIEQARKNRHWLVFCGHDIGGPARQTTLDTTLEALCRYSLDPANGVWIDTIARIARYVTRQRDKSR